MGSPPSWPFMDFNNTPLSRLLQEDFHPPPFGIGSSARSPSPSPPPLTPSPAPASAPSSHLLSSHASLGASSTKVSKRKSRAVSKPPITVLSADRESFRDMVQKLTGIPTSPITMQSGRLWGHANSSPPSPSSTSSSSAAMLFRPMAARAVAAAAGTYQSEFGIGAMAHPTMPTLDTSSAYLTRGFSNNSNLMYNGAGRLNYEGNQNTAVAAAAAAAVTVAGGGAMEGASSWVDGHHELAMEGMPDFDSILMANTKLEELLQSRIEPWFSPHVEVAHSA